MATKRRRLKTKKKNNKTRKIDGGINLTKALWGTDDEEDAAARAALKAAAEKKKQDEEGIEMSMRETLSDNQAPEVGVDGTEDSLDEIKRQFPQRNPNRRKSPKMRPSLNESPDEDIYDLLDKADNNTNIRSSEKESEPKLADIAEVARKVSLAIRNAVESMKVEKKEENLVNVDESEEEAEEDVSEKKEHLSEEEADVSETDVSETDVSEADVSEAEAEAEAEENEEELAEMVKDAEKQQSNAVDNANISLLGVAASNVADAIANILKTNEVEGAVAPMPSVVTPPVLPNSVDDSENLSLDLRNPNPTTQDALPVVRNPVALKAKTVVGETNTECPSAGIEISEKDEVFTFKGMNEPTNKKGCEDKKTLFKLHPDKNLGCSDEAKKKFQNFGSFCQRFEDSDKNSPATDEEIEKVIERLKLLNAATKRHTSQVNDEISNINQLKNFTSYDHVEIINSQIDEYRKSQRYDNNESIKDLISQIETDLKELSEAIEEAKKRLDYHPDADKIKQINDVVKPAIETLLFKSTDQLRKQVTDYKKYTDLLLKHYPVSASGGGSPAKPTMAQLAQNVMENGFIIGIERPVDDETYKAYEYSNYKIFADELGKSNEPEAQALLADFKENEMKYMKALQTKLTPNEKLRLIVDSLDGLENDTTGGSTIIRNYAIHRIDRKASEIIELYKNVGYLKERRQELQKGFNQMLRTKKQLTNDEYILYMTLKELFEWLKPKYVLFQYKLEGKPLFRSFGENFIKNIFYGRMNTMNNLKYSIDALINIKIMTYDPATDDGMIDNLKCYKKGKTKCNEIEYLELEKFPKQLADSDNQELAKVILADYNKKYAKKYTRKNTATTNNTALTNNTATTNNRTFKNYLFGTNKAQPTNPVIINPKFNESIMSDLPIGYNTSLITDPQPIIIKVNKTGLTINNELVDTKDKWDAVREKYLGFGKSSGEYNMPTYMKGELKFIIYLQQKKMIGYINGSKEILINNSKNLDLFKSALNKISKY